MARSCLVYLEQSWHVVNFHILLLHLGTVDNSRTTSLLQPKMGGGKRKPPEVKIAVGRGTAIAEAVDSLSAAPTTSTTGANRLSRPSATPLLPPSLVLDPSLKATTTTVSSQVEGNSIATTANVENFRKAASGYLNDDRFSDLIIICKGKEFKVHRCFVCAHSKWFERCCSGEFLVSCAF